MITAKHLLAIASILLAINGIINAVQWKSAHDRINEIEEKLQIQSIEVERLKKLIALAMQQR